MANLLGWGKKRLEGVIAQANPFDNGATYNTVLQNRKIAPAPSVIRQISNAPVVRPLLQADRKILKVASTPIVGMGQQLANTSNDFSKSLLSNSIRLAAANLTDNAIAQANARKGLAQASIDINRRIHDPNLAGNFVAGVRPARPGVKINNPLNADIERGFPIKNPDGANTNGIKITNNGDAIINGPKAKPGLKINNPGNAVVTKLRGAAQQAFLGKGEEGFVRIPGGKAPTPASKPVEAIPLQKIPSTNSTLNQLKNPDGRLVDSTTYKTSVKDLPKDIKLPNVTHQSRSQKTMEAAATKLVNDKPKVADETFFGRTLADSHPDSHAKLGNALFQKAVKEGDVAKAQQTWNELKQSGTQQGQGLRAYYFESRLSPQGIALYAQKVADMQGKKLTGEQFTKLQEMAKKIEKMPDSEAKGKLINDMMELAQNRSVLDKSTDLAKSTLSLPRAMMASMDLSWGGRQGAVLGSRFPKEWAKANALSPKMAARPKFFETKMAEVRNLTDSNGVKLAPVFKRMGLDLEGAYGRAEEVFGKTDLAEGKVAKKLGVGHGVAASNRAFSGTASIMRSDVAKKIIDGYGGADEVMKSWTTKDFKDLGRVINTATGRGHGGEWFEKAAPFLGQTLFSARLWKSRLDMLNPVYYARLSPKARGTAIQSGQAFATVALATLAAASAAGAAVEWDPRSSDFAKIRIGNTRYDIMGGLQQNIVLAAREITGEKKSSTTGEVKSLTSGKFGSDNRLSVLADMIQNKETPVLATGSRLLRGEDQGGNPVNPWNEIAKMFIPLSPQQTYTAIKEKGLPKGLALTSPGYVGAGVQTYGETKGQQKANPEELPSIDKLKTNAPEGYTLQKTSDGKYAYTLDNGEVKQSKNLKDAKMAIAKDAFDKSGQSYKIAGDTVYRKSLSGEVSAQPKIKFDNEVNSATLTAQKNADDINGWISTAKSQLANIQTQLSNPNTDPLEKIQLQNQATTLQKNMEKYLSYGGFTKGKGGKKVSIPSIKTASTKRIKTPKISTRKVAYKAGKVKIAKVSVSKIPTSYKSRRIG